MDRHLFLTSLTTPHFLFFPNTLQSLPFLFFLFYLKPSRRQHLCPLTLCSSVSLFTPHSWPSLHLIPISYLSLLQNVPLGGDDRKQEAAISACLLSGNRKSSAECYDSLRAASNSKTGGGIMSGTQQAIRWTLKYCLRRESDWGGDTHVCSILSMHMYSKSYYYGKWIPAKLTSLRNLRNQRFCDSVSSTKWHPTCKSASKV